MTIQADAGRSAGALAGAFTHVVFKRLTTVEADASRSNQHEFNASAALREMFGREQPQRLETDFVWMPDDGLFVSEEGFLTWYDARARHPKRSEYRLYYRDNAVTTRASAGDLLLIGRRPDGRVLLLLAPGTGLAIQRIEWLFGIEVIPGSGFGSLGAGRSSLTDGGSDDGWDAEPKMVSAAHDGDVAAQARLVQSRLGAEGAETHAADWSSSTDPDPAPGGNESLARTVRGVLTPAGPRPHR